MDGQNAMLEKNTHRSMVIRRYKSKKSHQKEDFGFSFGTWKTKNVIEDSATVQERYRDAYNVEKPFECRV